MKHHIFRSAALICVTLGITFGYVNSLFATTTLGEILRAKIIENRMGGNMNHTGAIQMPPLSAFLKSGKTYNGTLIHDGRKRMYMVYVPAKYSLVRGGPAIMAFHGGGGNMENMAKEYELIEKADKEGFLAIFPNGTSVFRKGILASWNAGTCCSYAVKQEVDDVGFIRALAKKLKTEYRVEKYFAIGMSNGGLMSYRLACEASDVFSAIGSVAGTDNTIDCTPSRAIPVMHIHALDDQNVLYNGGCGPACQGKNWATEFTSVPDTITKWVGLNRCSVNPKTVLSNTGVTCELYSRCANNANIKLCTTTEGGHSWPGTDGNDANPIEKGSPSQAIDANDELWKFFTSLR